MSNIFYSQVDAKLQAELNARGLSGYTRSSKDLQYMLEKIANVQITAYSGSTYNDDAIINTEHGVLGGAHVRSGRYLPTGPNGYLTETSYNSPSSIIINSSGVAVLDQGIELKDQSMRIAPVITSVDVQIGDHSMGLLNKANITISIPNPQRDLDEIEEIWLRPGRNVRIDIVHPDESIITRDDNGGLLEPTIIPDDEKIKELYNLADIGTLSTDLRKMNEFRFYGLITSFEFSYQPNGTVDATISLTGTSNVYTDVSMWLKTPTPEEEAAAKKEAAKPDMAGISIDTSADATVTGKTEFYTALIAKVEDAEKTHRLNTPNAPTDINAIVQLTTTTTSTDRFLLFGDSYPQTVDTNTLDLFNKANDQIIQNNATAIAQFNTDATASIAQSASLAAGGIGNPIAMPKNPKLKATASIDLIKSYDKNQTNFNRYITLGALIEFINLEVVYKIAGSVKGPNIICDDKNCFSNYYEQLVSCIPNDILFMPLDPKQPDGINSYGDLIYYKKMDSIDPAWPGTVAKLESAKTAITGNESAPTIFYPSRIFINVNIIHDILLGSNETGGLTAGGSKGWTLRSFMNEISKKISWASGGAILMELITHPNDQARLLFTDVKFLKTVEDNKYKKVYPYSVPMLAGHEFGTIVREFSLKARLPENAKNLAYVLNSGDDISEEDVAPYMNFMYNSKSPEIVNEMTANYKKKYNINLSNLQTTRIALGKAPMIPELGQAMHKVLTTYVKYPTDDITKSAQMTAPIFPFDAEFTIDGISGFRYGDVLQFKSLPAKYTANTVFSIIGITHTVTSDGAWTTLIRCIMRPSLD